MLLPQAVSLCFSFRAAGDLDGNLLLGDVGLFGARGRYPEDPEEVVVRRRVEAVSANLVCRYRPEGKNRMGRKEGVCAVRRVKNRDSS